jgi:hypothetical protein
VSPRARRAQERSLTDELSALLARTFVPDLRERARQPAVAASLRHLWSAERTARRTANDFDEWAEHTVEQVGAAWILSCVFVRTLEDRSLLERRRLAGEGALDSQEQFFAIAPSLTERDYVLTVFRELAAFPGAADVLGRAHNPAWRLSPSNESVRALLELLRRTDDDGQLHFRFEGPYTRQLGDLYQDLSESVRKRYALLQTPEFVERFILEQTLAPAVREFGLEIVRVIDPTCGSGHFLLGTFEFLFDARLRASPGVDQREHAAQALAQVYGIDVNPYAVAIARFRLTLSYLERAGIKRLAEAPRIETNILHSLDQALGYVGAAIREQHGEAAYVHGSFGSGKSHFMAVLSLLIADDNIAWGESVLHPLREKHEWVKGKKILRLHFNMIGARTTEERLFTEYLKRVRELNPEAPVPALFEDEALFANAQS